ncbi:MAG TPA: SDR family oxidoreductase [Pseudonocardiaceae bacterium]|jgi:NAD(P)-dependent dehydrogenase (short-subunit alcohol dehydrogenase family)|nr:SDR family oxidoreductase [Pseudonocardiaceae bacterium]
MGMLDGKAIVVTGAGRGLGEAYATHVAHAGAQVIVNDIDAELAKQTAENIRLFGGTAVDSGHDITDPEQAANLIASCVAEFGKIDGLVNNAGLNYEASPLEDDYARMRELFDVNVFGLFSCGVAAIEAMRDASISGSIVNIASGALLGQRRLGAYAASKGAVASLTYSWALDLDALGIRVNAVCPVAHTRMVWKSERSLRSIPPDRTPSKVAPLVVFLLADAANGITGQLIRCNGSDLHVVGQPYFKQPILHRDTWDTTSVTRAFDEVFQAHLEPFGLEKRLPQRLHELLEPGRSA